MHDAQDRLVAAGLVLATLAILVPYYAWQLRAIRNERKDPNQ